MSTELDPNEFYRTNDMTLATYLRLEGHAPQQCTWEGGTCFWIFRITDALLELTEIFLEGGAKVEPREFSRVYSQTKRQFYDAEPQEHRQSQASRS